MGIPDNIQTLLAAFTFGTVFQAAAPAILLFTKGHGKTVLKDGRRLVLVLFLIFAALWSQIEFFTMMMPTTMNGVCAGAVVITTSLDQLARVVMEQFLLWSVGHGTKMTTERMILQGILLIRLIAGGILAGVTRSDFAPTCVARTSALPVGIVVLILDAMLFGVLMVRAVSLGMFSDMRDKKSNKRQESRALVFTILGFGIWTATSVPMILGIPSLILILRTVLPANGLLILATIVVAFSIALLVTKAEDNTTPEARSPFMNPNPMPQSRELFRDNIGHTGSPVVGHGYTRSGSLFVVNPSTPNESPTVGFQGSSKSGDTRGFTKLNEEIAVESIGNGAPTRPERPDRLQVRDGPGYRGSSGIFPSMLPQGGEQGALAPQIRPNTSVNTQVTVGTSALAAATQQKRSIFGRSKPSPNVRNLGISGPVSLSTQKLGSQSFAKIPTIDLATAARMERERREEAVARSQMIAGRPAPRPVTGFAQDYLRESISVKRKEIPYFADKAMPTIPGSTSGSSVEGANGSTTSALLSPGRDEVRRRSPRSGNGFNQAMNEKGMPQPTLQRKQTIGLPSNPRSQRMTMAKEAGMAKEQTVMLMNDFVYDNPAVVKTIINDASTMYVKRPKTAEKSSFSSDFGLKSSNSIIHRPRPYKKSDGSKDRQLFPSEPSPGGLKRSKSSSSLVSKKSVLRSQPGSPSQLPPLPPPPTTASKLKKLLPNNTKSMTFDEKIELLFPAPPGLVHMQYRRSSVPSLPQVPSVFMADSTASSPTEEEQRSRRQSKRTTLASFGFDNPDITASSPKLNITESQDRQTYRFSAQTYRTLADDSTESTVSSLGLLAVPKRQSVLNDLRKSHMTATTAASEDNSVDYAVTDWGSIHSKVPVIDLSKAMMTAQPTFIQRAKPRRLDLEAEIPPPVPALPQVRVQETLAPTTFEMEAPRRSFLLENSADKESFFLDDGQVLPGDQAPHSERGWHRRIGDDLPTFSDRMKPRSRKMPPPTPLLLSRNGRQATVVVRNAEPSPPADSPERAIKEIQEQLRRFEDPNRVSVGSLLERLPNGNGNAEPSYDENRLRLLENLEMEMGEHENHWQQIQTNLDRDSMSMATPQPAQSGSLSRESSQRSSRPPSRVLDRRSRIRSGMTVRSKSDESSRGPSTDSSDNSRASVWQQRLADAQMEYTANAPDLLRKRSLNFLSVQRANRGPGNPTPPESLDSETEIESETDNDGPNYTNEPQQTQKKAASLWQEPIASPQVAAGRLWNHPYMSSVPEPSPEPPAKNVRPAPRRIEQPLQILSVGLWTKPRSAEHSRPVVGLWGSKLVRPRSIVTRPVTQRPARKSRRVTFLPDIVESPIPLPHKRDTLGIFQFPWGEKSDQPVYQPAFNPALLIGPLLNAQLHARSHQLEPESSAYSSSFFDDYEEGDEDDEIMDTESDDDFDETTLWEIAGLLNSNDVPSTMSLLPRANNIIEDYESGDSESEESLTKTVRTQPLAMPLPIQPLELREFPRSSLRIPSSNHMWTSPSRVVGPSNAGLFSKPASVIRTTDASPAAIQMAKAPRKACNSLQVLTSDSLWTPVETSEQEIVWITKKDAPREVQEVQTSAMMWYSTEKIVEFTSKGLFDASIPRTSFRTTEAAPAALDMIRNPRKSELPLDALTSTKLWHRAQKLDIERDWISESSIRPETPSVCSEASSSRASSPVSDSSSVKSTSTKASSVWEFSSIPIWWDQKKSKSSPSSPPAEDAKPSSKIPLRQASKPLASVRESRVLASRDMFEVKAPSTLEKKPSMKFCRQTISKAAKPSRQAMRQKHRPSGTFQVDWDEALAEAIAASPIKPTLERVPSESKIAQPAVAPAVIETPKLRKIVRPIASEADWSSALSEAVSRSQSHMQRPQCTPEMWTTALASATELSIVPEVTISPTYDASVMHPVFFTERLVSNIIDVHPAAIGHVSKNYDAAAMHPVFFTESLVSDIADIHPAAIGHFTVKKLITSGMWSSEPVMVASKTISLWTKTSAAPLKSSTSMAISAGLVRKPLPACNLDLPVLQSTILWTPSTTVLDERNWLVAAKPAVSNVASQTWTPRAFSAVEIQNSGMWAAKSSTTISLPDLFANVKHEYARASSHRSEALPALTSTSLFVKTASLVTEIHWLHTISRLAKSDKPSRTTMWTAPAIPEPRSQAGMWSVAVQQPLASPDLFAHLKLDTIRATPSRSVLSTLPVLVSNKLFEVAVAHQSTPDWLHQTSKPVKSMTWTAPAPAELQSEIGMWAATTKKSSASPDLFAHLSATHMRATPSRSAALPLLTSSALFEVTATQNSNTHWLHKTSRTAAVTTRSRSTTWTAKTSAAIKLKAPKELSSTMWIAQPIIPRSLPSPMLFTSTHTEPWTRPKRSDSAVSGIESTELWHSSQDVVESPKNWLAGPGSSKVDFSH